MTIQDVKNFCFDVLGDLIPLDCYDVQSSFRGFKVIILRTCGLPKDLIREEWNSKTKGTEFEKISLYI